MLTPDDVRNAYRFFLGREPEDTGVVDRHLSKVTSTADLRFRFMSSPEFYKTNSREILRNFAAWEARKKQNSIEVECKGEDLERIFRHIQQVWSSLGDIEPHFSVVSTPNYKPENLRENMESFFRSGKSEVDLLKRLMVSLEIGGIAVFQLPTHIQNYSFSVSDYINKMGKLNNQELNALPQAAVFGVLAETGCDVLNVYRDNSLSRIDQVSNRFVVRKR
jgi:hypothetical protein